VIYQSNRTQVLLLLATRPHNREELMKATGLDSQTVKDAVNALRRHGLASSGQTRPVIYEITQRGRYRLDPDSDPMRKEMRLQARLRKQARNSAYKRAKRALAKAAIGPSPIDEFPLDQRIVPAPRIDDGLVATAIRCRPVLQEVWR